MATQIAWVLPGSCPPGDPGWFCHVNWSTPGLLGRRPFTGDRRYAWIPHPADPWSRSLHRGRGGMGLSVCRHDFAAADDAGADRMPRVHAGAHNRRVLLDNLLPAWS